jgi:predicted HAD superfamily Cof-like phosphohydrolase
MKGFDVQGAWDEVARSNLSKIDPVTGKVIKRNDGKVLKPEGWTPPDLKPFVK